MQAQPATAARPAAKSAARPATRPHHRQFHSIVAAIVVTIMFIGFAESYYLKGVFDGPALSGLLHLHGLVMTLWIGLFFVQARLVATRHIAVHRRVGMWGMALGALVLLIGIATAIDSAHRHASPRALAFLATSLGGLLVFIALVALGYAYRSRRAFHWRFMLMANLSVLAPGIARIPLDFIENGGLTLTFILNDLCILAFLVYDVSRQRRLHPATGWASLLVVATYPATKFIGALPLWLDVARMLAA